LLAPRDPAEPFDQSCEPTVAVHDGHVVIAAVQLSVRSYGFGGSANWDDKRVAVFRSADRGATFSAAADPIGTDLDRTTNAVVRAARDGTFWLGILGEIGPRTGMSLAGRVTWSRDDGASWSAGTDLDSLNDKGWLAIADDQSAVFIAGAGGAWKLDPAGAVTASTTLGHQALGAYADETGIHFATFGYRVYRWRPGMAEPAVEGEVLPDGGLATLDATCLGFGRTADGRQWMVRTVGRSPRGLDVLLRVRRPGDDEGTDLAVSSPGETAFFPAGALDDAGRLHVMWYDSSGPTGVLRYARSRTAALIDGFTESLVVDADACPGDGWQPSSDTGANERRLRDYVDLAVDGSRAYLVWTHAPRPPARVQATYIDWP
jgi:hypothetical protein